MNICFLAIPEGIEGVVGILSTIILGQWGILYFIFKRKKVENGDKPYDPASQGAGSMSVEFWTEFFRKLDIKLDLNVDTLNKIMIIISENQQILQMLLDDINRLKRKD